MKNNLKILYLIPARGGSKGVPNKNIKLLAGKPLIYYSIKEVLKIADKEDVCLSTDSDDIKDVAEKLGLQVPFVRPKELATDTATTEDVILHALDFYNRKNISFDYVVLLQPTSPLRKAEHILEAINIANDKADLVVSVKETDANPYYVLFEEQQGILKKCKEGNFTRRQDCPIVYELNGAVYVIKVRSLLKLGYKNLKMAKFLMPKKNSIDIDDEFDFKIAEILLKDIEL